MSTAIYLLDQTHRQLDLAQGASAKDACEAMARALGLIDSERVAQYFAIVANVDGKRREIIIPEQDSVSHWAPRCHKLFFRILTFVDGVLHSRDPGILNLRYIQAVHDVLSGRLSVPEHLVEHLAALQLQKRYGPFNKSVHKSGFVVDHMLELVPRSALPLRKPSRWESDIFAAYEGLSGRRIDPSAEFLNLLEGLKRYGEHRFSADRGNSPSGAHGALIASRRGISFEPTDESWEWTEIASWSMKSNNPQWIDFDLLRPEADASGDGPSDDNDNNESSVEFLCTDEDATDLAIVCWKYAQVLASASRPLVDVASPPTAQRRNLVSYESDGSISTLRAQPGSSFKSAANRSTQSDDEDNRGQSDDNQDEQSDDDLGEQGVDNHAGQDNDNQGEQSVDDHAEQLNNDHSEHALGVSTDRSVQNNTIENVGSKDADDTVEKKESDSRRRQLELEQARFDEERHRFAEERRLFEEEKERYEEERRIQAEEEEEAKRLREEAKRKDEEARLLREEAMRKEEEERLLREEAMRKEEEERLLREEAMRKEEEERLLREEAMRKEEEERLLREEAMRKEEEERLLREGAMRKEEEERLLREEAMRKEEEERLLREGAERKEAERKEAERKEEEEEASSEVASDSGNVADDTTSHRTTSKELISDDEKSSDHGQALNKDDQDADPDRSQLTDDNNNDEHGESERPDDSEESLRERAAILLQAHARGVLQRIRIDAELAAMEEEAREVGAVRIQAAYRGYAARRAFDEMEEEFAAIFIQAHVRRFLVRCKTASNIGAVSDESLPSPPESPPGSPRGISPMPSPPGSPPGSPAASPPGSPAASPPGSPAGSPPASPQLGSRARRESVPPPPGLDSISSLPAPPPENPPPPPVPPPGFDMQVTEVTKTTVILRPPSGDRPRRQSRRNSRPPAPTQVQEKTGSPEDSQKTERTPSVPLPPRVAPPGLALYGADEDESEDDDDDDEDTRGDNDNKNTSKQVENAQATEPRVPAPRPPSVPPPSNTQPFIPPQPPRALPPNAPDDGEYSV